MKKSLLLTGLSCLMIFCGCRLHPPHKGSVTIHQKMYEMRDCSVLDNSVYAIFDATDTSSGMVTCTFDSSVLPIHDGSYATGATPDKAHPVAVYFTAKDSVYGIYASGGSGPGNLTVRIKNGKISISSPGIEMVNPLDGDSGMMAIDLIQTR